MIENLIFSCVNIFTYMQMISHGVYLMRVDCHRREVPDELLKEHGGEEVDLSMEDHRDETFVKPKSKVQSFSGPGNSLLT